MMSDPFSFLLEVEMKQVITEINPTRLGAGRKAWLKPSVDQWMLGPCSWTSSVLGS